MAITVNLRYTEDIMFLESALLPSYTVGHRLTPKQLLMEGILICNGQLGFMMMASDYVKKAGSQNLVAYSIGFSVLIFVLTLSFVKMNYGSKLNESQ